MSRNDRIARLLRLAEILVRSGGLRSGASRQGRARRRARCIADIEALQVDALPGLFENNRCCRRQSRSDVS
jgi:hypothetical protein